MMRRIVCISLPCLPLERWRRRQARTGCLPPDDQPFVLWAEGGHGPVIHAANAAAVQGGVRLGARLADTRTICPGLWAEPADPQGDAAALDRLALWARRFCPWTAADRSAPDAGRGGGAGLVMDTSGADHLWGGEDGMLAAIEGDLAVRGLTARAAVAPTWGAAWGLARFGGVRAVSGNISTLSERAKANPELEVVQTVDTNENLGVAVKKGNTELLESVNKTLDRITEDGTMDSMKEEWMGL